MSNLGQLRVSETTQPLNGGIIMSMKVLVCPHCHQQSGTVSINNNVKMSVVHKICSKCHKSFSYQGDYGKLRIMK